jgi:hypothetical protein
MRYATLFATLLLLAGCAGPKQTAGIDDTAAPPEANIVIAHTDMDAESAYRKTAQVLQNRGYTFRSADETLMNISTEFTGIAQRYGVDNTFTRIGASVQGDSEADVVVRGWYRTLADEDDETGQRVKKFGQNGSPTRSAWKEVHEVADAIGDSLSYEQQ